MGRYRLSAIAPIPASRGTRRLAALTVLVILIVGVLLFLIYRHVPRGTSQVAQTPPPPANAPARPSPTPANVTQPGAAGPASALPQGWLADVRQVRVLTPNGVEERQITYYTNPIGMRLVLIPAGEFMMGGDESPEEVARKSTLDDSIASAEWYKDEQPQHKVRITKPFYMCAYEVSQGRYEMVMGQNPSDSKGADNPVENVSWDDATEFCKRLSQEVGIEYRLPTEAECEYACRARTMTPFYTGATISTDQANYNGYWTYGNVRKGEYRGKTMPVGTFPANAFGLFDMHGNVCEWCADFYDNSSYARSPNDDPKGPDAGGPRVVRGGYWASDAVSCRAAHRFPVMPSARNCGYGFRVVCCGIR